MANEKCPDCGAKMITEFKNFDDETGQSQYWTRRPNCNLAYTWWDGEFDEDDYICPQCGGDLTVKSNSDGTMVETICDDCSYYSVDVE